jgi:hypothetical protein
LKRPKPPSRPPATTSETDLVWAEIHSGIGSGRGLNEKIQSTFGIPYAFLTEEQWKEIASKAGLRDSAHFELNIALRRYWLGIIDKTISPETLSAVAEARKRLQAAFDALAEVMTNDEFYKGPVAYHQRSPLQQRLALEATCESIYRTQTILAVASERLASGPGPAYSHLYDLIHHLDFILYKTHGIYVSRSENKIPVGGATHSPKEYVQAVVEAANLNVPWSTVETVLKDYIKDRGSHDRSFPKRSL